MGVRLARGAGATNFVRPIAHDFPQSQGGFVQRLLGAFLRSMAVERTISFNAVRGV